MLDPSALLASGGSITTIVLTGLFVGKSATYAVNAVFICEWLQTIPDEVQYIWQSSFSAVSLLYIIIRYTFVFAIPAYSVRTFRISALLQAMLENLSRILAAFGTPEILQDPYPKLPSLPSFGTSPDASDPISLALQSLENDQAEFNNLTVGRDSAPFSSLLLLINLLFGLTFTAVQSVLNNTIPAFFCCLFLLELRRFNEGSGGTLVVRKNVAPAGSIRSMIDGTVMEFAAGLATD
ncbi:hypothetical protein M422DRAFT_247566 [Sphaerobolus stellatus SS14]|nr:hypothetical protein M422DRAFT_247566 [Sphaerobolus stellatus SS14]